MDFLTTKSGEMPCEDKREEVWQMMTVETLSEFQEPSDESLVKTVPPFARPETPQSVLETEQLDWEREHKSIWVGRTLLNTRKRLGELCGWTGPARTCAISVATAIDEVMNILPPLNLPVFEWPLDVLAYGTRRRIWFSIPFVQNRWRSNFAEIEAALSLGLFGVQHKTDRAWGVVT
jgi:hypothetical protein